MTKPSQTNQEPLDKVDLSLWKDFSSHRIKIAREFAIAFFYGRRFSECRIGVSPIWASDTPGFYKLKSKDRPVKGYGVRLYLETIDDMLPSADFFVKTPEEAREKLKFVRRFLSVQPRKGLTREFFEEYFKDFRIEYW